jgi:hypothetical protein
MSGYGPMRNMIRALVLEGKTDDDIREQFRGQLRHCRMKDMLRIVRADLEAKRSTLPRRPRVIEERDGERFIEFAPGHVAKESALRAIKSALKVA